MVTVLREAGFRFVIFSDDHEPAHVHVIGDGMAKINLLGQDGQPELVSWVGFKAGNLRKAYRIVLREQTEMLERWKEIHG